MILLKCFVFISSLLYVRCEDGGILVDEVKDEDVVAHVQFLVKSNDTPFCSGVFFSAKAIVAPAECAFGLENKLPIEAEQMVIVKGLKNRDTAKSLKHEIEKYWIHPTYNIDKRNLSNIGVWHLKKEITDEGFLTKVFQIPEHPPNSTDDIKGYTIGLLGEVKPEINVHTLVKQYVRVYSNPACTGWYNMTFEDGLMCANEAHKSENTSVSKDFIFRRTDTGAPLIVEDKILVGLLLLEASGVSTQGSKFTDGIYTDIHYFRDFLLNYDKNVSNETGNGNETETGSTSGSDSTTDSTSGIESTTDSTTDSTTGSTTGMTTGSGSGSSTDNGKVCIDVDDGFDEYYTCTASLQRLEYSLLFISLLSQYFHFHRKTWK